MIYQPTLTEALAAQGYTHRKGGHGPYSHEIIDADGEVVFTGTANETWKWLADQVVSLSRVAGAPQRGRVG